jgi:hypothetical protein
MLLYYVLVVFNMDGGWEGIDQRFVVILGVRKWLKFGRSFLVVKYYLVVW